MYVLVPLRIHVAIELIDQLTKLDVVCIFFFSCTFHIVIQSFAQFRTFAQFWIIQIEEYLILLNDSAGEFKLLSEKVHSLTDIFI